MKENLDGSMTFNVVSAHEGVNVDVINSIELGYAQLPLAVQRYDTE